MNRSQIILNHLLDGNISAAGILVGHSLFPENIKELKCILANIVDTEFNNSLVQAYVHALKDILFSAISNFHHIEDNKILEKMREEKKEKINNILNICAHVHKGVK